MVSKVRVNGFENFGKEDGQLEVLINSQLRKREEVLEMMKSVGEDEFWRRRVPRLKRSWEECTLAAGIRSNWRTPRGDRRNFSQKVCALEAGVRSN